MAYKTIKLITTINLASSNKTNESVEKINKVNTCVFKITRYEFATTAQI